MLIGLCGGLSAGKREVAQYLVSKHGFNVINLESGSSVANSVETFSKVTDLLEFVTKRWTQRFVITEIRDEDVLDELSGRPFFILITVDAPVHIRWLRSNAKLSACGDEEVDLETFCLESDKQMFNSKNGILRVIDRATIKLINSDGSLESLYQTLDSLNITDLERLRPGWDAYFMALASLAAKRSNCMKRRVGCVLVREKRVIATGYNGAPRGLKNCNEGGCGRCNSGAPGGASLATCLCIHAEENALLEAGRERVGTDAVLYCDTCPCLTCSIKIVQVGISEVVYNQGYSMDHETAAIFHEGGVKLRQFSPPRDGLLALKKDN